MCLNLCFAPMDAVFGEACPSQMQGEHRADDTYRGGCVRRIGCRGKLWTDEGDDEDGSRYGQHAHSPIQH